jgi:hypothetical protein
MNYDIEQKLFMYDTFVRVLRGGNIIEMFAGSILRVQCPVKQQFRML